MSLPLTRIAVYAAMLAGLQLQAAELGAIVPLSPKESAKRVHLPPGYRLEPVLSEPEIEEPTAIAFDEDGRMFVAEMRTYMKDADGTGEHERTSRVSLHEDTDGDGVYDKHTVFADNLLLPRMILPLQKGRVIIGETDTNDLHTWIDCDGDGVADVKEVFYAGGPRGGNMEHQPSGLLWSLDNWIYTTYNSYRLRWTPSGAMKEATAPNGGQWGLSQDDSGKPWFINGGGEQGPVNFQAPIAYGAFQAKGQFAPGFDIVWPLVGIADVQGGEPRFRPQDGTLNHFTATCGADVFRGDRLPEEMRGDLFFGEPVGRLIRHAKVAVQNGLTYLSNPYGQSEFLRSTDALFRPVNMATAPDGTMYIVDMYRGIIQEAEWTRPGTYIRGVIEDRGLDKHVSRGRIWRLVHEDFGRGPQPAMSGETSRDLVRHLAHPNGWWRDTAQKLIIVRGEREVIPALVEMAGKHPNPLARLHAIWTLEGLDAADVALIRTGMKDPDPRVRGGAIRVSESLFKRESAELSNDVLAMIRDSDSTVAIQAMLTANSLHLPGAWESVVDASRGMYGPGPQEIAEQIMKRRERMPVFRVASEEEFKLVRSGQEIYNSLCAACHAPDGKGMPLAGTTPGAMLAPPLAGSKTINDRHEAAIGVLLHGLSGDIEGKKYEGQMASMGSNDDHWIAAVLSYVRMSFGNAAKIVKPEDVAKVREETKERKQPWTIQELRFLLP